jgi:lipopolysaccharide/colanic/teichoic acid biosynthesis glycosyltransferase
MTPLLLNANPRDKKVYELCKRLFDIIFSIIILIITLPLFLIIASVIRLNSPGPIIFSHQRIGQNRRRSNSPDGSLSERRIGQDLKGKPITIYKFRTMRMDVDPYHVKPRTLKDERLTSVGRFLRAACLDELPQFINVLKGDMSIVGPRPEMPFIVEKYGPVEAQRLLVKPGITGLWQIYGSRKQPIHENIHYDFDYIQNQTLILDFFIIIKTALFVFRIQNI